MVVHMQTLMLHTVACTAYAVLSSVHLQGLQHVSSPDILQTSLMCPETSPSPV